MSSNAVFLLAFAALIVYVVVNMLVLDAEKKAHEAAQPSPSVGQTATPAPSPTSAG